MLTLEQLETLHLQNVTQQMDALEAAYQASVAGNSAAESAAVALRAALTVREGYINSYMADLNKHAQLVIQYADP